METSELNGDFISLGMPPLFWEHSTTEPPEETMTKWTNSSNLTSEQIVDFMFSLKKCDEELLSEYTELVAKKVSKKMAWGRRRVRNFEIILPRTAYSNLLFGSGKMDLKTRLVICNNSNKC